MDLTFWVTYKNQLDTQISLTQTADISTLDFGAYGGLVRFDGNKFAHSGGYELTVAGGGNKSYKQTFSAKLLTNSTADDVSLQQLALGNDAIIIAQTNNREFFIYGAGNGLTAESATQNTGQTGDSDTTDTITLSGQELTKPLRFSQATYQQTLDYLESFEI
jgi:hypothetical protein